jgi:Abortive infection alpha
MSEELIRPIDAETAKAISDAAQLGSKMADASTGVGRYAAGVLGNLPHNLVGIASDYVAYKRLNRAVELEHDYKKLLADRAVLEAVEPSPSIAVPLLEAAVDEDREVLKDLWTRLLANACDPKRHTRVRLSFINLLKKLDPLDAEILCEFGRASGKLAPNARNYLKDKLAVSENEVVVSLEHLIEIGCLSATNEHWNPNLSPRGSLLLLAVSE